MLLACKLGFRLNLIVSNLACLLAKMRVFSSNKKQPKINKQQHIYDIYQLIKNK